MPTCRDKPPIVPVLESLGFTGLQDSGGWRPVKCLFHNDKHASASYSPDEGRYKCHGCDAHGDAYDLIMQTEGADFATAQQRVQSITGGDGSQLSVRTVGQRSKLSDVQRARAGGRRLLQARSGRRQPS